MPSDSPAVSPRTETGVVCAGADGALSIAVPRSACGACGNRCGIGRLMAGSNKKTYLPLPAGMDATAGDTVSISIDPARLNRAALLGYLLPAAGLVIGAALGDALGGDPGAALGGLAGLLLGLGIARLLTSRAPQEQIAISPLR